MTDKEAKRLLEEKYYYLETGRLCWREDSGFRNGGQVCGWRSNTHKYRTVKLTSTKNIPEHRAIFLMHFGHLPEMVDHINGDPLDNRVENLRASDARKNSYNRKLPCNNRSGYKGVIQTPNGKWRATIRANGKTHSLGTYEKKADAIEARQEGEKRYHGESRRQ